MKFLNEFKTFINKGNVVQIAVGLIMAEYFGAITKSLVRDIIMPPVGKLIGGVDFSSLKVIIQKANEAKGTVEVSINYGQFINTVITFIIVAFVMFLVVKWYNALQERMSKPEPPKAEPTPPKPGAEEQLLTEIRDLLKERS